jgi:Protein of unknown function (DUF3135)
MKVTGMSQFPGSDFDFEEWASLATTDPQAFEARREKVIARFIAGATPHTQTRLRGLQWRIDMDRRRASNPLASCMQIFNRMWTSVYGDRGLLDALRGVDCGPLPERPSADVVKLDRHVADRKKDLPYPYTHT